MYGKITGSWIASIVVSASILSAAPAAASPRMISIASGPESFRQKLAETPGNRFVVDGRSGNALGGENIVLEATRSGALDVAVLTGGVVSAVFPERIVFNIPFLFRDD